MSAINKPIEPIISPQPPAARVALDCRYIGPRPNGIAEAVAALARHLPALAPEIEFTFLRHAGATAPLIKAPNVREVIVRAAANGPVTMFHLPWAARLGDIDLFHAPANILPGGLAMPTITTIHDIMWLNHPNWCNPRAWGWIERAFYGFGIKRALARSALITTVSSATKAEIAEFSPEAAERVVVIPSGVATDFAPTLRDEAELARIGIPAGHRYVLVVGQGSPYKNHEGALRAFALAAASRSDFDLVLVQRRGSNWQQLQRLSRALGC